MTMFFAYNAKIPSKRKKIILIPYAVMLAGIILAPLVGIPLVRMIHEFDYATFWMGLSVHLKNSTNPISGNLFLKVRRGGKRLHLD